MSFVRNSIVGATLTLSLACGGGGGGETASTATDLNSASQKANVLSGIANIAQANYAKSLSAAQALEAQIDTFISTGSRDATHLQQVKDAWINSRWAYGQTEAFRLSDDVNSPIDGTSASGANGGEGPEGQINAWPLDETLIDNILGNTVSGVTGTIDTTSSTSLAALNGLNNSEDNVATGFHAIEYLLWGKDTSAQGPGNLAVSEFTTSANATRRLQYLKSAANLLNSDIKQVASEWATGGSYRTTFVAESTADTYLDRVLTSLSALSKSELAGERIGTFVGKTPSTFSDGTGIEEEHSCFSDQTHRDIYLNFKGIYNLLTGSYKGSAPGVTGAITSAVDSLATSTSDVTATSNILDLLSASTRTALTAQLELSKTAVEKILDQGENGSGNVFDQLVLGETANTASPGPVFDAVIKLQNLGDTIVTAGTELGLTIAPGQAQ